MFSAFCNVSNATPTTFPSLNAGPPLFPAFMAASIWHNKYLSQIQFKELLRKRGYSVSALCSQKPVQNLDIVGNKGQGRISKRVFQERRVLIWGYEMFVCRKI